MTVYLVKTRVHLTATVTDAELWRDVVNKVRCVTLGDDMSEMVSS
jgi:hypothetical protein